MARLLVPPKARLLACARIFRVLGANQWTGAFLMYRATNFARPHLPVLLQFLSDHARERWPEPAQFMNSDLAWQLPGSNPKEFLRLWYAKERLAGFAWFQPPCLLLLQLDSKVDEPLAGEMLNWGLDLRKRWPAASLPYLDHRTMDDWAEAIRNPRPTTTSHRELAIPVMATDDLLEQVLESRGFALSAHREPYLVHDLGELSPSTPSGYKIAPVPRSQAGLEAFVAAHRSAWAPSEGFTLAHYERVRGLAQVFEPELNLVATHESGEIAACSVFWRDASARIGSVEPFGTRPAHRGTGVSKALILAGLVRLKKRGMRGCRIYTAGFNAPAQALYGSCGFKEVAESRTWTLRT